MNTNVTILPVPQAPREAALARDAVLDALQDQSFETLIEGAVAELRALADAPPLEGFRRQMQNIAIIHSDDELRTIVRGNLRHLLVYDPGERGDDFISAGEPITWTTVAVAFGVGVAAGLAASAIYDWATDNESTVEIETEDGTTIEMTIDDEGRIIRQKIVGGGSR